MSTTMENAVETQESAEAAIDRHLKQQGVFRDLEDNNYCDMSVKEFLLRELVLVLHEINHSLTALNETVTKGVPLNIR